MIPVPITDGRRNDVLLLLQFFHNVLHRSNKKAFTFIYTMLRSNSGDCWNRRGNREALGWDTLHFKSRYFGWASQFLYKNFLVSIYWIPGLTSLILLIITLLNGICALWAVEMRKIIRPLISKLLHNLFATATFVIGMASIIDACFEKRFMVTNDPGEIRYWMAAFGILIVVLSVIPALKNAKHQIKTLFFWFDIEKGQRNNTQYVFI